MITTLFDLFMYYLTWQQRKKPLPNEVADIYSEERYQTFLAYKKEYRPIYFLRTFITFGINCFVILSNFFTWFDFQNPYMNVLVVWFVMNVVSNMVSWPLDYYCTFKIEEKYGLNKQTKKDYFKDLITQELLSCLITVLLIVGMVFLVGVIGRYTSNMIVTYKQAIFFDLIIVLFLLVFFIVASLISLFALRKKYMFTRLEDGPLREKIESFLKESPKKIKEIYVYDESKKTTEKNAFVLKIFFYREIGIADNFLNENDEDELLAVLLHEIGHLKHKKNSLNYISYLFILLLFVLFAWMIVNKSMLMDFDSFLKTSFGLQYTSYYLWIMVISIFFTPINLILNLFNNYRSCQEEKEADFNAVDHGYGQALITTFKKLSSDELVDVNPHPFVEMLEHDHPSMAHRIAYIKERGGY